ncbi:hypothetical protein RF11_08078 [Thelohanellus kitauei]|uniref:Uncharacterized protein n=1 Tax=Thelohanellus kitauei TaxID=669202 RepID=A0A0C2MMZ8_THEKT|nr:hypothetical protein RF11_08078 [Thelohanellus kitauei]
MDNRQHSQNEEIMKREWRFAKVAELANLLRFNYTWVIKRYEEAAGCFLEINDSRAFSSYLNAIKVILEKGNIEKGVQSCVQYGYKCQQKLCDAQHAVKLYGKADELSDKHNLSHTCVMNHFDRNKYGGDVYDVFDERFDLFAGTALMRTKN